MISEEEFKELAHLARLDPNDASLKSMRSDLGKILDFVEKIKEIDVKSVSSDESFAEARNVSRKDTPVEPLAPHDISARAPDWEFGHFVVPGIIETE